MKDILGRSYAYCERLARREAGNFYPAFRVLPRDQRQAMCALYAFLRVTDDISDGPWQAATKREKLASWQERLHAALAERPSHRLHRALCHTIAKYRVPVDYLNAVFAGVEMDLEPRRYATFSDLYPYCFRVASVVGLACIHIWGFAEERAKEYAEAAGIAFQLTNILRDLREDACRGRCYIPEEDLKRFGYDPEGFQRGERGEAFRNLMRFEIQRARAYYETGKQLGPLLPRPGRAVFWVMSRTYSGLLVLMERRDYDVFTTRIHMGRWRKLGLVARALPVRAGWQ